MKSQCPFRERQDYIKQPETNVSVLEIDFGLSPSGNVAVGIDVGLRPKVRGH